MQENLDEKFEIKKTLEITLVGLTSVRLTSVQENRGGRPDAARPAADVFGIHFRIRTRVTSKQIPSLKTSKTRSGKNIEKTFKTF